MAEWIFDEDINRTTVEKFNKAGIKGLHIKYDLDKGGTDDVPAIKLAQKQKKTFITANKNDFVGISNVDILKTYGAWILGTDNPNEQVKLVKLTLKVTKLDTLNKRWEKKVHIKGGEVDVIDCRSQRKITLKLPKK